MPTYVPSIGMEVHAELATRSKMFCRCPVAFGGEPNTRVCPVCLGLPGALPVPNRAAVEMVLRTALALKCEIAMTSVFHRKNYFYPDLPKGYQISQYGETNPLGYHGRLTICDGAKTVSIRRVHLEEDTGKLVHTAEGISGIDYNRSGVPLMEIVTGFPPDISSADEARSYLTELRLLLLHLGVCDGKMEEGSLRAEPNVSVRALGASELGAKTELKNLSSFRAVELGIGFEIGRQTALLDTGGRPAQETRGWNEEREESFLMRGKEGEQDYRYFTDPDLPAMCFEEEFIETLRAGLPELPQAKRARYQSELGLGSGDAARLIADPEWSSYFERAVGLGAEAKPACNWMLSDFARLLNESGGTPLTSAFTPAHLADLVGLVESGRVSGKTAKALIGDSFAGGEMPSALAEAGGLSQISDGEAIRALVAEVLDEHADVVIKYRAGNANVKGFLVGAVMKKSGGRANANQVNEILSRELDR